MLTPKCVKATNSSNTDLRYFSDFKHLASKFPTLRELMLGDLTDFITQTYSAGGFHSLSELYTGINADKPYQNSKNQEMQILVNGIRLYVYANPNNILNTGIELTAEQYATWQLCIKTCVQDIMMLLETFHPDIQSRSQANTRLQTADNNEFLIWFDKKLDAYTISFKANQQVSHQTFCFHPCGIGFMNEKALQFRSLIRLIQANGIPSHQGIIGSLSKAPSIDSDEFIFNRDFTKTTSPSPQLTTSESTD